MEVASPTFALPRARALPDAVMRSSALLCAPSDAPRVAPRSAVEPTVEPTMASNHTAAPSPSLRSSSTCLESDSSPQQRRPIARRLRFGPVTTQNVEALRKLNVAIFPVRYNDTFYDDVLFTPSDYTKFAYWDDVVVGAICCRFEPLDDAPARQRVYIMTLGVLSPYRQCGIGRALLQSAISSARRDRIDHMYLHVQTSNAIALAFYQSFGFAVTQLIPNYYKRIKPPDCYLLVKTLRSGGGGGGSIDR